MCGREPFCCRVGAWREGSVAASHAGVSNTSIISPHPPAPQGVAFTYLALLAQIQKSPQHHLCGPQTKNRKYTAVWPLLLSPPVPGEVAAPTPDTWAGSSSLVSTELTSCAFFLPWHWPRPSACMGRGAVPLSPTLPTWHLHRCSVKVCGMNEHLTGLNETKGIHREVQAFPHGPTPCHP